jgi:hypothetical protein
MGKLTEVMEMVALDVFEQLGFLLADPEPVRTGVSLPGVRVAFEGPTRGAVVVRGDDVLLDALAMNMLGSFEEPEVELRQDALGEIANVICGNLVPRIHDAEADYRLHAPHPVAVEREGVPVGTVTVGFEGGVATVEWYEEQP